MKESCISDKFFISDILNKNFSLSKGRPPWYNIEGKMKEPFVIGICGGSGSGKSTVSSCIIESLKVPWIVVVSLDSFYKPLTKQQSEAALRSEYDFDHPEAIDFDYAINVIEKLKCGKNTQVPIYNFVSHSRENKTITIYGANVIIVEGIMAFYPEKLKNLINLKIFVETDGDIRLSRRLLRDVSERGRDVIGVIKQYQNFVKPNYDKYVANLSNFADMIISWNYTNMVSIDLIVKNVRRELQNRGFNLKEKLSTRSMSFDCVLKDTVYEIIETEKIKNLQDIIFDSSTDCKLFKEACDNLSQFIGYFVMNKKFLNICTIYILRGGKILEEKLMKTFPSTTIKGDLIIQTNPKTSEPELHDLNLPDHMADYQILLVDDCSETGSVLMMAIRILLDHEILENNIWIVTFFMKESAIATIQNYFPSVKFITSKIIKNKEKFHLTKEIGSFSDKYFGSKVEFKL